METKHCPKCGKYYSDTGGIDICPFCKYAPSIDDIPFKSVFGEEVFKDIFGDFDKEKK